jgi:PAS domain S-box-containing protein
MIYDGYITSAEPEIGEAGLRDGGHYVQNAPRVTFLTNETATLGAMIDQVKTYLGNLVEVVGYSLELGLPDKVDSTVVVVTTEAVLDTAKEIIPHECRTIVARRSINYAKMEELLNVSPGTKVVVASKDLTSARETTLILKELGMDHVDYVPWVPGLPLPGVEIAITSGGPHLAPPDVQQVINLGFRPMDISTMVDIVLACGLPTEMVNAISLDYIRGMVRLNQRLLAANTGLEESSARLHTLISFLDEGVVYMDRNGIVEVCNQAVQDLLGVNPKMLYGKQLAAIAAGDVIRTALKSGLSTHGVEDIATRRVSASVVPVLQDTEVRGAICVFRDVSDVRRLEQEIAKNIGTGHTTRYTVRDIYGKSPAVKRLIDRLRKIAATDLTVLITGESGVGKEVAAQAIHNLSSRKNGPFVAVNFAALPETLAESELFGYEEGSFTGARRGGRRGYFEEAHKGTIFLDEIGDASPTVQASLLRVLQEKRIIRVGGNRVIQLDFRVIAATNRSLKEMVAEGRFRRDLCYRLNVLNLAIPPLRERKGDIPELINYFLMGSGNVPEVEEDVMQVLRNHDWPGNIRELQNVVSHIVSVYQGPRVTLDDLPETLFEREVSSSDSGYRSIVGNLEKLGDLQLFCEILEVLQKHAGPSGVGRTAISSESPSHPGLHTVRTYVGYLAEVGACIVGSTRQGTRITAMGSDLLGFIRLYLAGLNGTKGN